MPATDVAIFSSVSDEHDSSLGGKEVKEHRDRPSEALQFRESEWHSQSRERHDVDVAHRGVGNTKARLVSPTFR